MHFATGIGVLRILWVEAENAAMEWTAIHLCPMCERAPDPSSPIRTFCMFWGEGEGNLYFQLVFFVATIPVPIGGSR